MSELCNLRAHDMSNFVNTDIEKEAKEAIEGLLESERGRWRRTMGMAVMAMMAMRTGMQLMITTARRRRGIMKPEAILEHIHTYISSHIYVICLLYAILLINKEI